MNRKKEPCRNFQRGSCQYGERCKFLHVTQQQPKPNVSGFGAQTSSNFQHTNVQQQRSNPFGFGVQSNSLPKGTSDFGSKQNHFKPFENKWTRFSPLTTGSSSSSSRQSDNQVQPANHKCTDPESCKRQIVEDFEHERPIWKLTCYGHCKSAPCDIVGDISYEELRLVAYDDAGRGLSLQSIVGEFIHGKLSSTEPHGHLVGAKVWNSPLLRGKEVLQASSRIQGSIYRGRSF